MRIVFMGTPDFAVPTFEALLAAGHEIVLAVTQPDRPKGRHGAPVSSPVKEAACTHGIAVYQPERLREPESVEYIKQQDADVIVVVAYGQILPEEILAAPRYGCVNVHASLLPKYRGAAPIQWSVIDGEEVTGVTTMRMDAGLDTGDIILTEEVALAPDETGGSLFGKLSEVGARLCVKTLAAIEDGSAVYTPQDSTQATKAGMIKKEMGRLDWTRPAVELERLVRGLDPWPGTYTHWGGRTLKIRKAAMREANTDLAPGTVADVTRDEIAVQTGNGLLVLKEVQPEGKKSMPCDAFLRGYSIHVGDIFSF